MRQNEGVSVAMCTYNGEKYLREQLESIVNQTLLPSEMIICDDGSIDSTVDIVTGFARHAPFYVNFIRNPQNLGTTKNFEQAIAHCTGELIALCDQDDVWSSCKLATLAPMFADDLVGGVFSDGQLIDENSDCLSETLWNVFGFTPELRSAWRTLGAIPVFLKQDIVTGATLVFRSRLRASLLPISPKWIHDAWIAWMIALTSRLEFIDIPLIRYRVHKSQQEGIPNLSLWAKLAGTLRGDAKSHLQAAKKFEDLRDRLGLIADDNSPMQATSIQCKISHHYFRSSLPKSRTSRLREVLSHLPAYKKYSRGVREALKDAISC